MNISLSTPRPDDLPALERLYNDSFPPEERRPWADIVAGDGRPRLIVVRLPQCDTAGLVTVWRFADFDYIEHFAVQPSMRGMGLGAQVMATLRASGRPVLLEVEHPVDPDGIEARRIGFYRRCGLEVLPYDYVQPPYAPGLPSVPLLLMSTDVSLDPAAAAAILHREVYGVREN